MSFWLFFQLRLQSQQKSYVLLSSTAVHIMDGMDTSRFQQAFAIALIDLSDGREGAMVPMNEALLYINSHQLLSMNDLEFENYSARVMDRVMAKKKSDAN